MLEVLALGHQPMSGRMVAARVEGRYGHRQVQETLNRLVQHGIVHKQTLPSAHLYSLNRSHVAAEAITSLATLRDRAISRMRAEVESWVPAAEAAWLFGSFARADGDSSSDVDVLLLCLDDVAESAPWQEQVDTLAGLVTDWTGNKSNVIWYSNTEFESLISAGERLPAEVAVDGIRLAGRDIPRVEIRRAAK